MPDRLPTRRHLLCALSAPAGTALLLGSLTAQARTDTRGPKALATAPKHHPRGAVYSRFPTRLRAA
jgi:hypothetical protein